MLASLLNTSFAAEKKQYLVGFAQDTMANDWRAAQVKLLEAGFSKYPEVKFIYTDANGHTAQQIQDIEDLALQKVDVLITSPRDAKLMTPVVSRVYESGIPVVLITRLIETQKYTTIVTPDDENISRQAAQTVAKALNYKGKILMLQGVPTASTAIKRTKGFIDEIKKWPGIKISSIQPANYLRRDAILAVTDVLSQKIAFDAIYAQSDSMARGAILALKQHGIKPEQKVIVGIDYIKEARESIQNGEQLASFIYPTSAAETVKVTMDILHGKKVPKKIKVHSTKVDLTNVKQVEPIF